MITYSTSTSVKSTEDVSNDYTVNKSKKFSRKPSPLAKCIAKAGDVNAGALLCQIEYRFKVNDTLWKDGDDLWVAQTAECWCSEVGLTKKQYKRALSILKKRNLILVTHKKVRSHHRWATTFIRLSPVSEQATPKEPSGTTDVGPPKDHDSSPSEDACNVVPLGTDKKGEDIKGEEFQGKNFADKPQKGKSKMIKKKNQGKNKEDNKDKLVGGKVSRKDIEVAWINAHKLARPFNNATPFAGSDWNAAKTLLEKLGPHAQKAPAIVDAAVGNWRFFLDDLKRLKGLFNQGDFPCVHKLAKHADVLLEWWETEMPPSSAYRAGKIEEFTDWDRAILETDIQKKWRKDRFEYLKDDYEMDRVVQGIEAFLGEVEIGNIKKGLDIVSEIGLPIIESFEDSVLIGAIKSKNKSINLAPYSNETVICAKLIEARCPDQIVNFLSNEFESEVGSC